MEQIPGPRGLPIVGNLFDLQDEEGYMKAMEQMADIYGPVYQLTFGGKKSLCISSAELLLQFTDESLWVKTPPPALANRSSAQGLFLARNDDPDWGQAHRILAPAFGPLAIGEMFEGMKDIAYQMILKWARHSEDQQILLTDDFTRLTLDTIALCTMDYRFNSFYSDNMHPFVHAMLGSLTLNQKLSVQPALMKKFFGSADTASLKEYRDTMNNTAREIVQRRRANPKDKNDMLNTLLYGKDPKTGEVMRDELIAAEMLTFLVAGHETTSGLISFVFMELLRNPKTYLKAQQEVDRVLGSRSVKLEDLKDLKYVNAAMREALRMHPTAPSVSKIRSPQRKDEFVTICDGKYHVEEGVSARILLAKAMKDPSYFGDDAEEFNPVRMSEDNPNFDRYMKVWKPFGSGKRSCIGQAFAWQEAVMVTTLILQNFDMSFVDPGYKMKIKQTLTVKPDQLYVKVRPRHGLDATKIEQRLYNQSTLAPSTEVNGVSQQVTQEVSNTNPTILFGSNSGTCQSLAQKLTSTIAIKLGHSTVSRDLDSAVNNISAEQPLIIITASYEGQPPDNAARFVTWLENSGTKRFDGVKYAVFGCGHKDWHETYQRIPTLIDTLMEDRGATRLVTMGTSDVSQNKVLDDFARWQEGLLNTLRVEGVNEERSQAPLPEDLAEISTSTRAQSLTSGLALGRVKDVSLLTAPGQPEKRHMEVELPEGTTYEVGDYLSVLPLNPEELIHSILNHWSLPEDATITLKTNAFGSLPTNTPLGIRDLLKGYFELSHPISKSNINDLKTFTSDADTLAHLDKLLTDEAFYTQTLLETHTSLFELLTQHPAIKIPFQTFLSSLLPMHIRQYSISSSPLQNPRTCTITYTVVRHDSHASTQVHQGVASTYLSTLKENDTLHLSIKRTATANLPCPFRLPAPNVQATTPLIMYCAGTGLAPFRAFIQHRAITLQSNPSLRLAPALLFIGCRSSTSDRLYADELKKWEDLGVVTVRYAFSSEPGHELANGCKYVGDRILKDQLEVREMWKQGARVYMCGSRRVQNSVRDAVGKIFEEIRKEEGWSVEEMEGEKEKFRKSLAGRGVSDVFD